jgi:hypothetical protein
MPNQEPPIGVYNKKRLAKEYGMDVKTLKNILCTIPNFGPYLARRFSSKQMQLWKEKMGDPIMQE